MTQISNLFKQKTSKYETPIKRLFHHSSSSSSNKQTPRAAEPRKSIYKHPQNPEKRYIKNQNKLLNKRYFMANQLKKQIIFYNNQLMLTLIRNIFFILGGIISFNIIFTKSNQMLMLFNFLLFVVNLDLNFKSRIFGMEMYRIVKQILKLTVYCLNFHGYHKVLTHQNIDQPILNRQTYIILINAMINYGILALILPLIFLKRLKYHAKPYSTLATTIKLQITRFYMSLTHLLKFLQKPILLSNLLYWLTIIIYIIHNRDEKLLNSLIKLQYIFSSLLIYLCLFTFLYIIQEINQRLAPQLLVKNIMNLKLINLEVEDKCSDMVKSSVVRYLCRNSQIVWDTMFLSYEINYDLLSDYLEREFLEFHQKLLQMERKYEQHTFQQRRSLKTSSHLNCLFQFILSLKQIQYFQKISTFLYKKSNFMIMIGQIIHFSNNDYPSPINLDFIARTWSKIQITLRRISQQFVGLHHIKNDLKELHHALKQKLNIENK